MSALRKQRTSVKLVSMDDCQSAQERAEQTEQLTFEIPPLRCLQRVHGTCSHVAISNTSAARMCTNAPQRRCYVNREEHAVREEVMGHELRLAHGVPPTMKAAPTARGYLTFLVCWGWILPR